MSVPVAEALRVDEVEKDTEPVGEGHCVALADVERLTDVHGDGDFDDDELPLAEELDDAERDTEPLLDVDTDADAHALLLGLVDARGDAVEHRDALTVADVRGVIVLLLLQ